MRIAEITRFYYPNMTGGVENVVFNLGEGLTRNGQDVTIYCKSMNQEMERIYMKNSMERIVYSPNALKISKLVYNGYNIAHIHNYNRLFVDIMLSRKFESPIVITPHGGLSSVPELQNKIFKTAKSYHDRIIAKNIINERVSRVVALNKHEYQFLKHLGVKEERLSVIPNGIPDFLFSNYKARNTPMNKKYIITLARLHPIKRIEDVISAVGSSRRLSNVNYIIAGAGDPIYRTYLERRANELGMKDRVKFLGNVQGESKWELLRRSSVFVLASSYENQSVATMEAMALGVPVVVSDVGGMRDLVLHSHDGYVFKVGDIQNLKNLLESLILDNSLNTLIGETARSKLTKFKWSSIANRYFALFEKLN